MSLAGSTLLALVLLGGSAPREVGVDLTALDGDAHKRLDGAALEARIVLRLVQDGFSVVSPDRKPSHTLLVVERRDVLALLAPGCAQVREIRSTTDASLGELHLEVAQKASELLRACQAADAAPPPPPPPASLALPSTSAAPVSPALPEAAPLSPAAPPPAPPVASEAPVERGFEVGLAGSALFRLDGTDPLAAVDVSWGPIANHPGLGAALEIGWTPSWGKGVTVQEWHAQVGPGWRLPLTSTWALRVALLGGALLHRYSLTAPVGEPATGTRWQGLASLPVAIEWTPLRHLAIALESSVGVSGPQPYHRSETSMWRRSPLRLGLGLGMRWVP